MDTVKFIPQISFRADPDPEGQLNWLARPLGTLKLGVVASLPVTTGLVLLLLGRGGATGLLGFALVGFGLSRPPVRRGVTLTSGRGPL